MSFDSRSFPRSFAWVAVGTLLASSLCAETTKHVLVIDSYHEGYRWSDDELKGVRAALNSSGLRTEVYAEYGDSQRHSSVEYSAAWLAFTESKYRDISLDLIVAMDDYAALRALDLRSAFGKNIPIVFCGVNDYQGDSWILRRPASEGLVGVLERVTYIETANLVLKLLPGTKKIVFIGSGPGDPAKGGRPATFAGVRTDYIPAGKFTFAELADRLEKFKSGTVIVTSAFSSDSTGKLVSFEESIRWITSHSPVPVFGINKGVLGLGVVGGKLGDGFFQGKLAGEMGVKILKGLPPSALHIVSDAGEPFVVDYTQLKRWQIDESLLPPGSIVEGRPESVYEEHKGAIWTGIAFLAAQSIVIALLAFEVKRRKKAEKQLGISAEQYRALFEQSPMGLVEVALDGQWGLMNRKACEIVGCAPGERTGKTVVDMTTQEVAREGLEARHELLQGVCESSSAEGELIQESGDKVWVRRTFSLIRDTEHQPKVFMLTLEDVTRRKEAEQQLLRSNAALRHFAYAAAHDLQEPLRNVALASDLLLAEYKSHLDDFGEKLLTENVESAQRMLSMVKALLTYSEAVDAETEGPTSVVESERALSRALLNLQAAISEGGVQVDHTPLPQVRAQEAHLIQLFQNLIGNAVKYRKKDQQGHVTVSAKQDGTDWVFEVADNGIGFDPIYAERIFGVFKRLHSRREYPGTGIGLAVCARIVEHYGGRIWAEAEPSAGARFFFSLPGVAWKQQ